MKFIHSLAPIVVTAIIAAPFQSAQALSSAEVSAIAESITVRIDGQNSESGVTIRHQGDIDCGPCGRHSGSI